MSPRNMHLETNQITALIKIKTNQTSQAFFQFIFIQTRSKEISSRNYTLNSVVLFEAKLLKPTQLSLLCSIE